HSTVGRYKVDVMEERILDINPNINIKKIRSLYNKDTSDEILTERYDYVVDAIDMVSSKIHLIETCEKKGLKIISSMGMGNKLDPTKIVVTDIHKTSTCPLAKVMRKELRDRGIKKLKVVYSTEQPIELKKKVMNGRKVTPGSVSFVPSVGGLIIASVIVNELLGQ
ncbi:tRNA threonylcarbamoyladenosine dehydratase, partial [Clostridioides difficile]|nr:tRNA threonylcarbamoyladenosine dehydratase [Clostridioides difficile]